MPLRSMSSLLRIVAITLITLPNGCTVTLRSITVTVPSNSISLNGLGRARMGEPTLT